MTGRVVAIFVAPEAGAPMQSVAEAVAVAGAGLEGDRYRTGSGFYSATPTTPGARELTLIAEEALAEVARAGITFAPGEHRRNITTRGIALDPLLGRRFRIGETLCEGVRACPPCNHLEELTGKPVMKPMVDRGGLRARIVDGRHHPRRRSDRDRGGSRCLMRGPTASPSSRATASATRSSRRGCACSTASPPPAWRPRLRVRAFPLGLRLLPEDRPDDGRGRAGRACSSSTRSTSARSAGRTCRTTSASGGCGWRSARGSTSTPACGRSGCCRASPSPLRDATPETIDWVVVRENSEGEYAGIGGRNLAGARRRAARSRSRPRSSPRRAASGSSATPSSWRGRASGRR